MSFSPITGTLLSFCDTFKPNKFVLREPYQIIGEKTFNHTKTTVKSLKEFFVKANEQHKKSVRNLRKKLLKTSLITEDDNNTVEAFKITSDKVIRELEDQENNFSSEL